jgi:hypothetical protein
MYTVSSARYGTIQEEFDGLTRKEAREWMKEQKATLKDMGWSVTGNLHNGYEAHEPGTSHSADITIDISK